MGKIVWHYDEIMPADRLQASALILVLHGFGNTKDDYKNIGKSFASQFPEARIITPDAPLQTMNSLPALARMIVKAKTPKENFEEARKGRSWYNVNPLTLKWRIRSNAIPEVSQLNDFITTQLEKDHLPDSRLILFGFSQGGSMALMAGLRRQRPPGMVICHSGFLPAAFTAVSKPQVEIIRGQKEFEHDKGAVIRFLGYDYKNTAQSLEQIGQPQTTHIIPDLDHSINKESLATATQLIRQKLSFTPA
ncbi:MAG: alpha/beta hydrolase [Micavibrio sp.]